MEGEDSDGLAPPPESSSDGGASPSNIYPPSFFASGERQRFTLESGIFNRDGTNWQVEQGDRIVVEATFRNWQQVAQGYAAIIQVEDSQGITRDISWETSVISSGQTGHAARTLTAEQGAYIVKIFVWDKIEQAPSPLANISSERLAVR